LNLHLLNSSPVSCWEKLGPRCIVCAV